MDKSERGNDIYTQLRYVLFSWPKSALLRKDPLAKGFFKQTVNVDGLFALLGTDASGNDSRAKTLTLFQGTLKHQGAHPELFLSDAQCETLRQELAKLMGPSRAKNSWRAESNYARDKIRHLTVVHVGSVAELTERMEKLQKLADRDTTEPRARELETMRSVWDAMHMAKKGAFLALDVETWEQDHNALTEFGWSILDLNGGEQRSDTHVVVQENEHRRNGRYCADARDHYAFGTTMVRSEAAISKRLLELINYYSSIAPLFLIMHDPRSDLVALNMLGIDTSSYKPYDFVAMPFSGVHVLDTQTLFQGWARMSRKFQLGVCCEQVGMKTTGLHCAGNDARYTLDLFIALMNQREVR